MQDLWLRHLDTLVMARGLSCSAACEILVLCPGIEPACPGWQGGVPKAMFLSTTLQGSCDSCESTFGRPGKNNPLKRWETEVGERTQYVEKC